MALLWIIIGAVFDFFDGMPDNAPPAVPGLPSAT